MKFWPKKNLLKIILWCFKEKNMSLNSRELKKNKKLRNKYKIRLKKTKL